MKRPNAIAVRTISLWQILAQVLVTVLLVRALCAGQVEATLYLINKSPSGWVCLPSKETIMEGDKKIVELDRKHYAVLQIEPGHHNFHLKHIPLAMGSPPKVEIDALLGQTYYLVTTNIWAVEACFRTFKKISKGEAEKLIVKMKPQPANTALP
jgi:hypothetical protein